MEMTPVVSDNVAAVGYDATTRSLVVNFRSGGSYSYADVDVSLFHDMLQPHPWSRLRRQVLAHPATRLR